MITVEKVYPLDSIAQVPAGTYPIHMAEKMFDNVEHCIQAGMKSSYADMFVPVTVKFAVQMTVNGKTQSLSGQLVLGDGSNHGLADTIAKQGKIAGVSQSDLQCYLAEHIRIGCRCEQAIAGYDSITQDIPEYSDRDRLMDAIQFLQKAISDCDSERAALNKDIKRKSR